MIDSEDDYNFCQLSTSSLLPTMGIPKKFFAILAVVAAIILYLASSVEYNSPTAENRFSFPAHPVDAAPYTAAVVYLVSVMPGPRSPDRLLQSIPRMEKNIPWRYRWPIVLLHAGMYDSADSQLDFLSRLRDSANAHNLAPEATDDLLRRVEFIATHHELPEGIPADGLVDGPIWDGEWPAYHHMCAFFSYKIFNHPRIRDLTYYPPLGRRLLCPGARVLRPLRIHARQQQIGFGAGVNFPSYETNFDLVKVPRFRTPEMTEFLHELASDPKRFYWYRWGDAPVRFAEVNMFLDVTKEVHRMCEIPYAHKDRPFDDCECVPLSG
ncbi:hypothetical protein B0H14DRAFT_3635593 [Mycena olivaceomarginata]|nr:hypothetical protein B0H14DRAFT_3635593 [Mycena olivaceomarginata]